MIKCLILKIGISLITEISEIGGDVGEPDCQLINPLQILEDDKLIRWPTITDQRSLMIHSDSILTIVEPNAKILETYKEMLQ